MNVRPEFWMNPKYVRLRRRVGRGAMEMLCLLWGYCQHGKRGANIGAKSPEAIEAICAWEGEDGELYAALMDTRATGNGFIRLSPDGDVIVHGWEDENARLVTNWEMGDRPKTKPRLKPAHEPRLKPAHEPRLKPAHEPAHEHWHKPLEGTGRDLKGLDLIGPDGMGQEGSGDDTSQKGGRMDRLSKSEAFALAETDSQISKNLAAAVWSSFEGNALPDGGWQRKWYGVMQRVTDCRAVFMQRCRDRIVEMESRLNSTKTGAAAHVEKQAAGQFTEDRDSLKLKVLNGKGND